MLTGEYPMTYLIEPSVERYGKSIYYFRNMQIFLRKSANDSYSRL